MPKTKPLATARKRSRRSSDWGQKQRKKNQGRPGDVKQGEETDKASYQD